MKEQRERAAKQAKQEQEAKLDEQCTFKPHLCSVDRRSHKSHDNLNKVESQQEVASRLLQYKQMQKERLQNKARELEAFKHVECRFQPDISQKSRQIVKSRLQQFISANVKQDKTEDRG